jgi:hypothetical protein
MVSLTNLHPASLLAHLSRNEPLTNRHGGGVLRHIPCQERKATREQQAAHMALLAVLDNGNDALKGTMPHRVQPTLATIRIITAYAPARILRAGAGIPTWQVNDSEPFWIGEDALRMGKGESLPIGTTRDRLPDPRFQRFLIADLVELLRLAGYAASSETDAGEYRLYLGFGLPNEEVSRNGVEQPVREILRQLIAQPFTVQRTDEEGRIATWQIRITELHPYAQTFGSFLCWYATPEGLPLATDIVRHVTLDLGGGQVHRCEVSLEVGAAGGQRLRMEAALVDEGTITIARALGARLRERYPGVRLSDVQAQQALVQENVILDGRRTPINDLIGEVKTSRSQKLLTHLRHLLADEERFLMFTGGGVILLASSLQALVSARRSPQSFLLVPAAYASTLNALGGYLLVQTAARRRLADQAGIPEVERRAG